MASQLTVDNIVGATSASKVMVPGHVVQVQQSVYQTPFSVASNNTGTYVATNMTVSITPTSASNKIWVFCTGTYGGNTGGTGFIIRLQRSIGGGAYNTLSPNSIKVEGYLNNITYISYHQTPFALQGLDSPSTTSACSYQPYISASHGTPTGNVYVGGRNNDGLQYSSVVVTAMEIAQ